jgi:hypothetical protein
MKTHTAPSSKNSQSLFIIHNAFIDPGYFQNAIRDHESKGIVCEPLKIIDEALELELRIARKSASHIVKVLTCGASLDRTLQKAESCLSQSSRIIDEFRAWRNQNFSADGDKPCPFFVPHRHTATPARVEVLSISRADTDLRGIAYFWNFETPSVSFFRIPLTFIT